MPDTLTPYPDVNAVLDLLLAEVQALLGDQVVGLYLHGSLASGGFTPFRSDIDFLVVTRDPLPEDSLPALREMHARIRDTGLRWADHLEGTYISQHALRRHDPDHCHHPALRVEGTVDIDHHGSDWDIQRHILRQWGITLAGPDPRTLIDPVPVEAVRAATLNLLRGWWVEQLDDPALLQTAEYQVYAVLTMCRVFYTVEHGTIASKPAAAAWALETLDASWPALVQDALDWRPDAPFDRLDDVLALIRYTLERLG